MIKLWNTCSITTDSKWFQMIQSSLIFNPIYLNRIQKPKLNRFSKFVVFYFRKVQNQRTSHKNDKRKLTWPKCQFITKVNQGRFTVQVSRIKSSSCAGAETVVKEKACTYVLRVSLSFFDQTLKTHYFLTDDARHNPIFLLKHLT